MTADQSPAFSPWTVVLSVLPPRAHQSPCWAAQPSLTMWLPRLRSVASPISVTAVPETVAPSTTRSTVVVAGFPSIQKRATPPNPLLGLGEAAGAADAGADAGAAL